MAEYITKDRAKELVCDFCQWAGTANCEECEHPVDDSPAADVRPVVWGKWEDCTEYNGGYRCSVCKEFEGHKRNFCPNCGAMMDGETDG